MIRVDVEQNSQEWLALKAGVPSASNFGKIVTTKGVRSKSAEKYMYQLAGERITGIREDGYQSASMLRGLEMEEQAVTAYEIATEQETEKVGVCYPDDKKSCLCSPDRLIQASDGLLEIKCPEIQTHVAYLLKNELPTDYFQQIQGQLYVTGCLFVDFMSYYPGLKPLIIRVERDDEFIEKLDIELKGFCVELGLVVEKIR